MEKKTQLRTSAISQVAHQQLRFLKVELGLTRMEDAAAAALEQWAQRRKEG